MIFTRIFRMARPALHFALILAAVFPVSVARAGSGVKEESPKTQAKKLIAEGDQFAARLEFDSAREDYLKAEGLVPNIAIKPLAKLKKLIDLRIIQLLEEANDSFKGPHPENALKPLEDAARLRPNDALVNLDLAVVLYHMGEFQATRDAIEAAVATLPDDERKRVALELRSSIIQREEVSQLRGNPSIVKVDEFNDFVLRKRVFARDPFEAQKKKACELTDSLLVLAPDDPAVVYNGGLCAELGRRPEEAARYFKQYLHVAPNALDGPAIQSHLNSMSMTADLEQQSAGDRPGGCRDAGANLAKQ